MSKPYRLKLKDEKPTGEEVFQPDARDGRLYNWKPELRLATEVALVTGRPLLLRGEPGSGKSSFAAYVARNLKWRYYEFVVTARTQARDLMWSFDTIRRLNDAQKRKEGDPDLNDYKYVRPEALWWVFNRESAAVRGEPEAEWTGKKIGHEPFSAMNASRKGGGAVLLIDEIDKGDPDVPNNLLVPLGSQEFLVEETQTLVKRKTVEGSDGPPHSPLVVITTNQERALPQAFLRRCVIHKLPDPDEDTWVEIATSHFETKDASPSEEEAALFREVAKKTMELRDAAGAKARKPSTAEYLDAVRACRELKITVDSKKWEILKSVALDKARG